MTNQCVCADAQRREEETRAAGTLNGIEYLEVGGSRTIPATAIPATAIPPQRLLAVHCLLPVRSGMRAGDLMIAGGVRADTAVNPVRVQWAFPAAELAGDPTLLPDPAEREEALALAGDDRERTLLVRTTSSGDYSTYRLVVVDPGSWGFDPCLSATPFTFKVDCPTDLDPAVTVEQPVQRALEPMIDYLSRDYEGLRRLLLDRLSVVIPSWMDRNAADVGVMLVELFAYLGDHLAYAQDAVCAEAYLGTARRRISVARHARLLDYPMHQGAAARGWLVLEIDEHAAGSAPSGAGFILEAGRQVSDADGGLVYHTLHDVTPTVARNAIDVYTWSQLRCILPAGATRATLVDTEEGLGLAAGDVLIFEEVLGTTGKAADADVTHRCAVRLSQEPQYTRDPATGIALVTVTWHDADALPFPLLLWRFPRGICQPDACAAVARANVVLAEHGELVGPEPLDPNTVPATGRYRPILRRRGLTHAVAYDDEAARALPAASALAFSPQDARPQIIRLTDGQTDWHLQRDLLASGRFEPEYVVEMDDEAQAYLRFGDDVLGRSPKPGDRFSVTYRVGGGRAGICGRDVLCSLAEPVEGLSVRNPMRTEGGADAEGVEQVRQHAPQAFRVQERAVSDADYVAIAQRDQRVQRAAATRRWTGSWYTEFVTVDRRDGDLVDEAFQTELAGILDQYRMAGMDVEVDAPVFVPLDLVLTIQVADGHFRDSVKRLLAETFSARDLAGGQRGFFHPDNFTFAQPVYLSDLIARAMSVTGVAWVEWSGGASAGGTPAGGASAGGPAAVSSEGNRFRRWGRADAGERELGYLPMGRLEIARCDSDPSEPEHGRIDFIMTGGQ